jgi:hypothetical protein
MFALLMDACCMSRHVLTLHALGGGLNTSREEVEVESRGATNILPHDGFEVNL